MKRTYKSGAQKQRDKKKKLAEAARSSRSLSLWLGHQSRRIQSQTSEKAARNRDGSTTAEADWVSSATAEAEQVSSAIRIRKSRIRAMAKQQDNRRNIARVLTRKNKFLAKGFGKIIKCYFDAGNV